MPRKTSSQPLAPHLRRGKAAEAAAEQWLVRHGLKPLQRNYVCPLGEVDLILDHDGVLVFVEVRSRRQTSFGSPVETVTASKQRKIIKTAQHYVQKHGISPRRTLRFDVVGIGGDLAEPPTWIVDAFSADGY